jgi:hypothetical protein
LPRYSTNNSGSGQGSDKQKHHAEEVTQQHDPVSDKSTIEQGQARRSSHVSEHLIFIPH